MTRGLEDQRQTISSKEDKETKLRALNRSL